jgi:hypothetical protein
MTRSLEQRLAKLEAQSLTAATDPRTECPSRRRVLASRLLLEEAIALTKQADQLLATTESDSL